MDDRHRKEITIFYKSEINKVHSNDSKRDISTLLYSHSITEIKSIVKNLYTANVYVAKSLYKDIFVNAFLDKKAGTVKMVLNANVVFIFGNDKIFNNIANTHYKFIKRGQSFIIVRNGIVINHLSNENGELTWWRKSVEHIELCNEFDFISDVQKQKIIDAVKSMIVLNTLYEKESAVTLT